MRRAGAEAVQREQRRERSWRGRPTSDAAIRDDALLAIAPDLAGTALDMALVLGTPTTSAPCRPATLARPPCLRWECSGLR
jgi:hypothetical protein